jgi:mannose-6-phosphate isomerase-like protein (cupin superfamily)
MVVESSQMREEIRNNMRGGNGDVTLIHMLEKDDMMGKARLAARIQVPVGASVGSHTHGPDAEILIVLSGTALVDDNGTSRALSAGDIVFIGGGQAHSFSNAGDTLLEIIGIAIE